MMKIVEILNNENEKTVEMFGKQWTVGKSWDVESFGKKDKSNNITCDDMTIQFSRWVVHNGRPIALAKAFCSSDYSTYIEKYFDYEDDLDDVATSIKDHFTFLIHQEIKKAEKFFGTFTIDKDAL